MRLCTLLSGLKNSFVLPSDLEWRWVINFSLDGRRKSFRDSWLPEGDFEILKRRPSYYLQVR